jgi:hypothetical protein
MQSLKKDPAANGKGSSSFKDKKLKEQKEKSTNAFNWNSLYVRVCNKQFFEYIFTKKKEIFILNRYVKSF